MYDYLEHWYHKEKLRDKKVTNYGGLADFNAYKTYI